MDFQNLRDLVDGGGAGRAGAEFEGGGILSMIANALAKPLGSQNGQGQAMAQPQGLLGGMGSQAPAMGSVAPPNPVSIMPPPVTQQTLPPAMPDLMQTMRGARQDRAGQAFNMAQGMPSPEEARIIQYLRSVGAM